MSEEKKMDIKKINEMLEIYYTLKNKYETDYLKKHLKKFKNLNRKQKKILKSNLPKPQCVNCERNVGSLFVIRNNMEEDTKIYTISCGDIQNPCNLNIKFVVDNIFLFQTWFEEYKKQNNLLQNTLIKLKNDGLFNYINQNQLIEDNDYYQNELKEYESRNGFFYEKYILINENPNKKLEYIELMKRLGIELQEYKNMINEYKLGNLRNNKSAVHYYINNIKPLLDIIRNLKYDENNVEFDEIDKKYILNQKFHSIDNLENKLLIYSKLISNISGTGSVKKTKKKENEKIKKTKTKKNLTKK